MAARKKATTHHTRRVTHKRTVAAKRKTVRKRRVAHKAVRARGFSPSSDYAGCTVDALAASLTLTTGIVPDERELRDLFRRAAGSDLHGAVLADVLAVTAERGLGGAQLRSLELDPGDDCDELLIVGVRLPEAHTLVALSSGWWSWGEPFDPGDWPELLVDEAWRLTWSR